MIDASLPASDELEVSLFGPGVGECVVVHIGDGHWMVVDSCLDPQSKRPVALSYLDSLGVDSSNVDLIVISHWHDDHIGGAADLVTSCPNANVAYSAAYRHPEFFALVSAFTSHTFPIDDDKPHCREINKIFQTLRGSNSEGSKKLRSSRKSALSNRILVERKRVEPTMEVRSLSPSDAAVNNAILDMANLFPKPGGERKILARPTQNRSAVALWVSLGEQSALLGADLEQETSPDVGWTAIVADHQDGLAAKVFKIPHHGSHNGHSHEVWQNMLTENVTAIMTEYTRSKLPLDEDISRINTYTDSVYCTTSRLRCPMKRDRTVERTMKEVCGKRKALSKSIGHIRVRITQAGAINVDLNAEAKLL